MVQCYIQLIIGSGSGHEHSCTELGARTFVTSLLFLFFIFLFRSKLYSQRILIFIVKLVPRTVRVMVGVRVRVSVSFLLCLLSLCSCTEPVPI